MRAVCSTLITILLLGFQAQAQSVPQANLDKIINDFAKDGFKLESTFPPDFTKRNPNTLSRFIPCYTGKVVMVAAVMAFKPQNLLFKVVLNGKEAPKTHEPENLGTAAEPLYYDYRALKFNAKYVSTNQKCLNIILYDKAIIDKPVYTLVFTKFAK